MTSCGAADHRFGVFSAPFEILCKYWPFTVEACFNAAFAETPRPEFLSGWRGPGNFALKTRRERELAAAAYETDPGPASAMVSVVVCTRNREAMLSDLLDSMVRLLIPPDLRWELIIVDNGSTDETARVVSRYKGQLPVRRVEEPLPGLSHARNRGVREARGRYICWTDDDVLVDPRWLAAYVEAFARHPEAAIFGGRILPEIDPPTPYWFTRCSHCWPITSVIAHRDMGEDVVPVSQKGGRVPWGANFAVRAAEQRLFAYDPALGISPLQHRVGEESDVIYRIMAVGGTGWWVPNCKVWHRIPPPRQTLGHILDYFRSVGETAAYQHDVAPGDNWNESSGPPRFVGASPFSLRVRTALSLHLFAFAWLRGGTCSALRHWARLGRYLGVASYRRGKHARSRLAANDQHSSRCQTGESSRCRKRE